MNHFFGLLSINLDPKVKLILTQYLITLVS